MRSFRLILTKLTSVWAVWALMLLAEPGKLWAQGQSPGPLPISAAERTDSFETKMKLLAEAWEKKDYDLVRSLTHSLRDSALQTQLEEQPAEKSLIEAGKFQRVEALGGAGAEWARGWKLLQRNLDHRDFGRVEKVRAGRGLVELSPRSGDFTDSRSAAGPGRWGAG